MCTVALQHYLVLQTTNGIDKLLGALLESIARDKPDKPVQWMVDVFSNSSTVEQAVQKASQACLVGFLLSFVPSVPTSL